MSVAAVVLAAGGSRRMGQPKVLIEIDGETLVRRAARRAREAGCDPVFVIAGAGAEAVAAAVSGLDVRVVENRDWSRGIGSSIATGARAATEERAAAVLVVLADQPDVEPAHLGRLIAAFRAGHDRAGTTYGDATGVPAIFGAAWFPSLCRLDGDRGAKDLLAGAHTVPTEPPRDIDTPGDLDFRQRG
ncbi:MAG: nucleotidyltransferase family protein [Thermoanaerobaculia bacterium]